MSSSVIAVNALTKRYAARTGTMSALEEISFSVDEGECVAVVGRGKTSGWFAWRPCSFRGRARSTTCYSPSTCRVSDLAGGSKGSSCAPIVSSQMTQMGPPAACR